MNRHIRTLVILLLVLVTPLFTTPSHASELFTLKKLAEGTFAAIARQGGKAQSNALILIGKSRVMIAGAHFTPEVIADLSREIATLTPFPIRSVILTHHHKGFSFVDFDFPRSYDIILTRQARESMKSERRTIPNNLYAFDSTLSIDFDGTTIILTNHGQAHSTGDLTLHLPDTGILFTSDLIFNDMIGYMGDGSFRDWVELLDGIELIGASTIVPGLGEPSSSALINSYRTFMQEFLTEIIRLKNEGKSLKQVKAEFTLPERYRSLPGYRKFIDSSIEKAFADPEIR